MKNTVEAPQLPSRVGRPVLGQGRSLELRRCLRFSSSLESADIPISQQRWGRTVQTVQLSAWVPYMAVGAAVKGFWRFSAFFALLRVVLELSTSFWSPR